MFKNVAFTSLTVVGVATIALVGNQSAQAALIYDNLGAPPAGVGGGNISDFAFADDFNLTQAISLTDFTFWASGASQDSDLGNSIGWAIFNDNAGAVGSLVASGTDTTVTKTDTGLNDVLDKNILKVDGDFGGTINLTAGTYWISFRDGTWGSNYDFTSAYWSSSFASSVGSRGSTGRYDFNEANPTFPNPDGTSFYFQLFGDVVPSETVPEPSTILGLLAVGSIGALTRKRKA